MITAEKLQADYYDSMRDKGRAPSSRPYNYISSVGEECVRRLYYYRTEGDRAEPFPVHVLEILEQGNEDERIVKRDMMDAGYDWHEEQAAVAFDDLQLRGKHEGYIARDGVKVPTEIKSVSTYLFNALRPDVEYLKEHEYLRKHVLQFMTYLIGLEHEWGVMIYTNRRAKVFYDVKVDYDFWNEVPLKMKEVNGACEKGEAPERIDKVGNDDVCRLCPFQHICLPDVRNELGGVIMIDEPVTVENLNRMAELKPYHKEYESLLKWRKSRLAGVDGQVAGKFLIEGKTIHRDGYEVKPGSYWKTKITTLR